MRSFFLLLLSSVVALAGSGGGPAVYVVGNLDGVSPGAEGILVLEKEQAVFRSGKTVLPMPYSDIHNVELGTKVVPPSAPLYKVWQLHKRFQAEHPAQRMVNFEFIDKDGRDQSITLEFGETAANETLAGIEIHQGKRIPPKRATNGDPWWGDSLWKTASNHNTVNPEPLGIAPPQSQGARINEPVPPPPQPTQVQVSRVEDPVPLKQAQSQVPAEAEKDSRTAQAEVISAMPLPTSQSTQPHISAASEPFSASVGPHAGSSSVQRVITQYTAKHPEHDWKIGKIMDSKLAKASVAVGSTTFTAGSATATSTTNTTYFGPSSSSVTDTRASLSSTSSTRIDFAHIREDQLVVLGIEFVYIIDDTRISGGQGLISITAHAIANRKHGCRFIVGDDVSFWQEKATLHVIDADGKECKVDVLRQERLR